MARGRREGVLIAGGGVSGCLAALALARHRPDVPLLIVEERDRFGGDGWQFLFRDELGRAERALVAPLVGEPWPGFYLAFPGMTRNLKVEVAGLRPGALHDAMIAALEPKQYRLGTKVAAVREDALELDGGQTVKAQAAIDARGAGNPSMLDLLHETRTERTIAVERPHGLDRPLLIDATVEQAGGLSFVQAFPLDPHRLRVAWVLVSERAHPNPAAEARLDHYLALRGWNAAKAEDAAAFVRPLPIGGDFEAFWRLGGARSARLGLRGGFVAPASGRTGPDAARTALLLARQRDFSGPALHDVFQAEAKRLWRKRALQREFVAALAAAPPDARRPIAERLHALGPSEIVRFHADRLGPLERARLQRALRR
jgi:lycopene beta-cyclase